MHGKKERQRKAKRPTKRKTHKTDKRKTPQYSFSDVLALTFPVPKAAFNEVAANSSFILS